VRVGSPVQSASAGLANRVYGWLIGSVRLLVTLISRAARFIPPFLFELRAILLPPGCRVDSRLSRAGSTIIPARGSSSFFSLFSVSRSRGNDISQTTQAESLPYVLAHDNRRVREIQL